jgi:hypothetical protein
MKRPVFVVGCPRSGTTLLYSMLLAAGGFAVYRKETHIYSLAPRFPPLTTAAARERFLREFLAGYLGTFPGLDVEPLAREALAGARTVEEFLPLVMNAIVRTQHAERWIEATPTHVLFMREIRRAVPDAVFLHVIRDGRDCALSIHQQAWRPRCLGNSSAAVSAVYWDWMVRAGRRAGRAMPRDYMEVRFEDLIQRPAATLTSIGACIDHDLAHDRIAGNKVHSLLNPNSSFKAERGRDFNPVGRSRRPAWADVTRACERVIGPYLQELGYAPMYPEDASRHTLRARLTRAACIGCFAAKHTIKAHTPLAPYVINSRIWARQRDPREQPLGKAPEPVE